MLSIQEYIDRTDNKQISCLGTISQKLTGEIVDLSELVNLEKLEVVNSLITNNNLKFLDSSLNKEKLKEINFSSNRIQEIDFAQLFTNFTNLRKVNLRNNPVSAKNLDNLATQQFSRLVQGIKKQDIKIDLLLYPSKRTIAKELMDYSEKLIVEGNTDAYQLKEFIQEKQFNNIGNDKTPLIISC
jgi:hypothetical protein